MAPADFRSVVNIVSKSDPHEVYYLAGPSSVSLSFSQPAETLVSVTLATLNILEALRIAKKTARFYHASSSECFGDVGEQAAVESSPFKPRSPYGIDKTAAHSLAVNYRDRHRVFAGNRILFNHKSPLRPARFATRKIIDAARAINAGSKGAVATRPSGCDPRLGLGSRVRRGHVAYALPSQIHWRPLSFSTVTKLSHMGEQALLITGTRTLGASLFPNSATHVMISCLVT